MARVQPNARNVSGILLLDKPAGQTSNRVLQRVKRLYRAAKAGHTGSLDPMATGMLPICLGSATKVSGALLSSAKEYLVTAQFGIATDTGDADGEIVECRETPGVSVADIECVLARLVGESEQTPPMYSALKYRGKRLYELARQGLDVERAPRLIRIEWIRLRRCHWPAIEFAVRCSKGTYIRSLVGDIAAQLGTVGHVTALHRTRVDPFDTAAMVGLAELEAESESGAGTDEAFGSLDRHLLGADVALGCLPDVGVGSAEVQALLNGRAVLLSGAGVAGSVRIYGPERHFVGIGEITADGRLQPRRIFSADVVE